MPEDEHRSSRKLATERADELLTRVGWTAGVFASMAATRLARIAAFAREEAEDMWAEAQNMRQQNSGDLGGATGQDADAAREKAEVTRERLRQSAASERETESIKATETAQRLARELGVDLGQIKGTGSDGQITAADVKRQAKANYVS